jgi:transcriptional regulator with XRE-family HTH domain
MPKTVFTGAHKHLVEVLIAARKEAGLTQVQVAKALGKDQSFISIIEGSQRRVDVLEFYAIARALGKDPIEMFSQVVSHLPHEIDI